MRKLFLLLFIFMFPFALVFSQANKLNLTLNRCENLFFKNNLLLLASQYKIDGQKAQVIQARLWQNPYLAGEINAIDPENNEFFNIDKNGQKALAIQQLIYLGNKKHYEVQLAKTNQQIAELEYQDLLRELRFQLRSSFFNNYYDNLTLSLLDFQINNLDTLINAYAIQSQKGNVPLRDMVRLQSLYLTLRNNRTELANEIIQEQQKLSLITGSDSIIYSDPSDSELRKYGRILEISIDSLHMLAVKYRPDLLITDANISASEWNLKWQKSLIFPDITLGVAYNQAGGAFANELGLTLAFPLITWNRNQGNIQFAGDLLNTYHTLKEQKILEINTEVNSTYYRYNDALNNVRLINPGTLENFESVYRGVFDNFLKRNISLLEFTDFMESYNESINRFNQFKKTLSNVCEELNYVTGSNIF